VLKVHYRAADGQQLFAYVVRPATARPGSRGPTPTAPRRPRGVLVAFHGNADLAGWQLPWAAEVANRTGWAVFLAEYRGYDGLPGIPTYEGSRQDARAAYAFVRDSMGARPSEVAVFGHSLGSAVAAELASEVQPAALLLQSPFTSVRAMARLVITPPVVWGFWRVIARVHYDTETRVRTLDVPVHVAHGDRDVVVPVRMGRAVHVAARVPGQLLIARGRGHNDVDDAGDAYWSWVAGALGREEPGVASSAR
jgi:pimeloyl-ACP methyl ester carboxylesterase